MTSTFEDDLGLAQYFADIARYPLLAPREERELAARIAAGDSAALDRLVCCNLRLVVDRAKRSYHTRMPMLDRIQQGTLGLMHAAHKFDYTRGYRFSTYATWWIDQAISREATENNPLIHIPAYISERLARETRDIAAGRRADYSPLCQAAAAARVTWSLDAALMGADGGDAALTLGASLEDREAEEADAQALAEQAETRARIEAALAHLTGREAAILRRRYLDASGSLESIGREMGITRERVRQIEAVALAKLRPLLAALALDMEQEVA